MSAPVTQAQKQLWIDLYNLAHADIFLSEPSDDKAHARLADSEAKAVEAVTKERDRLRDSMLSFVENFHVQDWTQEPWDKIEAEAVKLWGWHKERTEVIADRDQLRAEVEQRRKAMADIVRELGEGCCGLLHEEIAPKVKEMRVEVERLRDQLSRAVWDTDVNRSFARAERAEAEVKKLTGFYGEIVAECGHDRIVQEYRARGELLRDEANRRKEAEASLHALGLVCGTTDADKFSTWVDRANARAEKAEAERIALVKANAEMDHAYRTLHGRLVTSQAELAAHNDARAKAEADREEQRWLKECAITIAKNLRAELAVERARLVELTEAFAVFVTPLERLKNWNEFKEHAATLRRDAIAAAMKEGGK